MRLWSIVSFMQFKNKVCAVLETIEEGFMLVGGAEAAAEVEHCVVIIQRQGVQKFLQLLESITDLGGIILVGFGIGLI